MSKHEQGGPAFPTNEGYTYDGMTLRDYIAVKAMQGMLAADTEWTMNAGLIAEHAYEQADAMLVERTK